jgi:hypothetical protein
MIESDLGPNANKSKRHKVVRSLLAIGLAIGLTLLFGIAVIGNALVPTLRFSFDQANFFFVPSILVVALGFGLCASRALL